MTSTLSQELCALEEQLREMSEAKHAKTIAAEQAEQAVKTLELELHTLSQLSAVKVAFTCSKYCVPIPGPSPQALLQVDNPACMLLMYIL